LDICEGDILRRNVHVEIFDCPAGGPNWNLGILTKRGGERALQHVKRLPAISGSDGPAKPYGSAAGVATA
jgi:hypothetical protein